jgi:hypothetical protein
MLQPSLAGVGWRWLAVLDGYEPFNIIPFLFRLILLPFLPPSSSLNLLNAAPFSCSNPRFGFNQDFVVTVFLGLFFFSQPYLSKKIVHHGCKFTSRQHHYTRLGRTSSSLFATLLFTPPL